MGWDDDLDDDTDQTFAENLYSSSFTTTIATYFDRYFVCYPLSDISKTHLEYGNKIIMPDSALDHLASLDIVYPMLFRIESTFTGRHSHCGVVEFTADEGLVFLPTWMMDNLGFQEGDLVNIKNTCLTKANYIKIQPHTTKFISLSDHKSLLENSFKNFTCLTVGDTIVINHEGEKYMIDVLETKPSPAVSMFETDCEVDFAPPLDYKEPEKKRNIGKGDQVDNVNLFPGEGRRVDGTKKKKDDECCLSVYQSMKKLKMADDLKVKVDGEPKNTGELEGFRPFTGKSYRF